MKRCSNCKEWKDDSEFNKNRSHKDGLQHECRECNNNRSLKWAKDNPERVAEYGYYWRENKKLHAERIRNWRQANPEKAKQHTRTRRARKNDAEGNFTKEELDNLYETQNGCCAYCGEKLHNHYEIDHIQPISKGGTNYIENIALACRRCNASKGNKNLLDWIVYGLTRFRKIIIPAFFMPKDYNS